ncbi:MAG: hypothetical protein DRJ45_01615 [Thermoprotei archaeon]|nr:MAG: hypothetical protein DRJ45_01615 [Thermoprotei archaeon]
MKLDLKTPLEVRVLKDKIAEWKSRGGILYIKFKDSYFEDLYIRTQSISFSFDVKHIFTVPISIINRGDMNEKYVKLYRILKGMEAQLEYKGIINRKPFFINLSKLNRLKNFLPDLKISNTLISILNNDKELLELIRKIKPGELTIGLKSMFDTFVYFSASPEAILHSEATYYKEPTEIMWLIMLSVMLIRGPSYKKSLSGIYKILNKISYYTREITRNISTELE